jgi:hypothetical protein
VIACEHRIWSFLGTLSREEVVEVAAGNKGT